MASKKDELLKLLLVGDREVGKSYLFQRFNFKGGPLPFSRFPHNLFMSFVSKPKIAVGITSAVRDIEVEGTMVRAQLSDIPGQDLHGQYNPAKYCNQYGTAGVLLVYDITRPTSFKNIPSWLKDIKDARTDIVIMLIGNKTDLHRRRSVATEDAQSYAEKEGLPFIETSALEPTNVDKAFKTILEQILKRDSTLSNQFLSLPVQPLNSIQSSGVKSTPPHAESMPLEFDFLAGKSEKGVPYQELEADTSQGIHSSSGVANEDAQSYAEKEGLLSLDVQPLISAQSTGVKSTPSHAESMPVVLNFLAGKSIERAPCQEFEDDTFQGLQSSLGVKSTPSHAQSIPVEFNILAEKTKIGAPYLELEVDTFQGLQSSSGNFRYLGSTNQAKDDLLKALQDDKYHIVRLFGERGSGKTALVKAEIPEYENIFHPVVFVTVLEKADIANLQNQIAPQLYLNIQAFRSQHRRASAIESTLSKSKDKVLVIFDDISTNFGPQHIEDIGIPDPSQQCKILLITHEKNFCKMIRCHPWIHLGPLSNEDAWNLLQQYSGIDRYSPPDLFKLGREVAFQCRGLPRVIEDVVSSLQNKNAERWTETLDCLRHTTACHQIFISFRGRDTRDHFTASLFDHLTQGGFKVFKDDEQLRSGDQVSEALIKAIEQSRCSIVVLSENYAESSWCLDELVKILKCREEMKQLVLPIFFQVDPSHVRHLKGSFGEAITKKKERFKDDKIQEWTEALKNVVGLSGRDYKTGSQIVFIKEIVQLVRDNKHRLHIV